MLLVNNYTYFKQLNMNIYMFSLSIKEILDHYIVDTYEEQTNPDGYQRPPIASHFKSIASHLIENTDSIFLPSAILGAIDVEDVQFPSNTSALEINKKIRIVDGQHRLKGFSAAIEKLKLTDDKNKLNALLNFELPIILMVIDRKKNERFNEIVAFIDINSKGKKVSTDLAITLRDRMYDQANNYFKNEDKRKEKIATETSKYLTKKASFSVWYSAIKMTPNDKGTIISVNSFNKSLYPIINSIDNQLIKLAGAEEHIQEAWVQKIIEVLPLLISDVWNIISGKWKECFLHNSNPKFNKEFNIQKGIGVHALHLLLSDCLINVIEIQEDEPSDIQDIINSLQQAVADFDIIIKTKTSVVAEDWRSGKKFSGYNSASGFKKVKQYISHGEFS
ncbi:DGQHR domain-containing protein [Bacillus cereus]|nr:DGQHR domain-containing protein [Bacillus cereus]